MTNEKPLKMNESQGEELVERDDDAIEILDTDTPTVPFKFSKKATTDDIVNIDADLIDMDSFHYLNKHSLVKAIVYMIKSVDQLNKDLSSVVLSRKGTDKVVQETVDTGSQWNGVCEQNKCIDTNPVCKDSDLLSKQVVQLNDILNDFQSNLLKSVDEKLSVVDTKISEAVTQLSGNGHIKSFAEVAEKASKHVENIAKSTISNVESVAKHSIDIVNVKNSASTTSKEDSFDNCNTREGTNSSFATTDVFLSTATTLNLSDSNNGDHVMVLTPVNPSNVYVVSKLDSVKTTIRNKLKKIPFEFINDKSKTGKIALRFPSLSIYNEADKAIDNSFLASVDYESKKAKKMLPKITLKGVPGYLLRNVDVSNLNESQIFDAKKQLLISQIKDKNPCIKTLISAGHTFEIVFISSHSNHYNDISIGLKVSPLVRSKILSEQSGYVYVGSKRCLFSDRFNIGQCYHCQLLGHKSQNCPDKDENSTCLYCMGNHRSNVCTLKNQTEKHCCAKCHNSNFEEDKKNYKSHNSASPDCPVYVRECQRLANITDFTSKNIL